MSSFAGLQHQLAHEGQHIGKRDQALTSLRVVKENEAARRTLARNAAAVAHADKKEKARLQEQEVGTPLHGCCTYIIYIYMYVCVYMYMYMYMYTLYIIYILKSCVCVCVRYGLIKLHGMEG